MAEIVPEEEVAPEVVAEVVAPEVVAEVVAPEVVAEVVVETAEAYQQDPVSSVGSLNVF